MGLGELLSEEWRASIVSFVEGQISAARVRVFDGNSQMAIVTSGFITGRFCRNSGDDYGAFSICKVWRTERCALREQWVYAGEEFEAQK